MSQKIEIPDINNCSAKAWEKWWWQEYADRCLKCSRTCKQSWRVKVECKQFEKIEKEEIEKEIING